MEEGDGGIGGVGGALGEVEGELTGADAVGAWLEDSAQCPAWRDVRGLDRLERHGVGRARGCG